MTQFTSHKLNVLTTVGRFLYGTWPTHSQLVGLHRRLRKS